MKTVKSREQNSQEKIQPEDLVQKAKKNYEQRTQVFFRKRTQKEHFFQASAKNTKDKKQQLTQSLLITTDVN